MDAPDCIFCKIVAGTVPATKLYEDERVLSFMDVGPISEGHTLVIPKVHYETVVQCPPGVLSEVASCLGSISRALMAATGCEGYNILCNNGQAAGQVVRHLHIHIIPRKAGDGVLGKWQPIPYPEGRMEMLAEAIRKLL